MAEPVFMRPVRPPRKYYKFWTEQKISDSEPMVETSDRFTDGQLKIKLVDDAKWKLDIVLFMVVHNKYKKNKDAWIKKRAWTYNLVLQNFPSDVEAKLKNQSTWTVGQDEQNVVTLLHMICSIMHNMKESKQCVISIVECTV